MSLMQSTEYVSRANNGSVYHAEYRVSHMEATECLSCRVQSVSHRESRVSLMQSTEYVTHAE